MILDLIAFIALSVLCLVFAASALSQRKARRAMLEKLLVAEIEKSIFAIKLSEAALQSETKKIEESEGFLKFISESRDWAFRYIEDTQSAIKSFDESISEGLEYLYKQRNTSSGALSAAFISTLYEEYQKLKEILPKDMIE